MTRMNLDRSTDFNIYGVVNDIEHIMILHDYPLIAKPFDVSVRVFYSKLLSISFLRSFTIFVE